MPTLSPSRREAIAQCAAIFRASQASRRNDSDELRGATVMLLYSTQPSWPWPSGSEENGEGRKRSGKQRLQLSVLDSSFNPPTLAHLALALSEPPPPLPPASLAQEAAERFRDRSAVSSHGVKGDVQEDGGGYDAHLLLLSARNADKGMGKDGDATLQQRMEMMELLAYEMEDYLRLRAGGGGKGSEQSGEVKKPNVAVALIDEPVFVRKSSILLDYLASRSSPSPSSSASPSFQPELQPQLQPQLHWLLGIDTLARFFAPRYYPSEASMRSNFQNFFEKEGNCLICARRDAHSAPPIVVPSSSSSSQGERKEEMVEKEDVEQALLGSPLVKPWVEAGSVRIMDIGQHEMGLSSTAVRRALGSAAVSASSEERLSDVDREKLECMIPRGLLEYALEERLYATKVVGEVNEGRR